MSHVNIQIIKKKGSSGNSIIHNFYKNKSKIVCNKAPTHYIYNQSINTLLKNAKLCGYLGKYFFLKLLLINSMID
jgi:hypothetical protein